MNKKYNILLENKDISLVDDKLVSYQNQKYIAICASYEEYWALYFNLDKCENITDPILLTDVENLQEFRYLCIASIIIDIEKPSSFFIKKLGYQKFPFKSYSGQVEDREKLYQKAYKCAEILTTNNINIQNENN